MRDRVETILEHIGHVQQYTKKIGLKMIERGEESFGITLIKNGLVHDQSKLQGIELEFLHNEHVGEKPLGFNLAWKQHVMTNPHHSEFWSGIKNMPRIYIAEMVADWVSRCAEKAECFDDFLNNKALAKYQFSNEDSVYKEIIFFKDMIVEKWN